MALQLYTFYKQSFHIGLEQCSGWTYIAIKSFDKSTVLLYVQYSSLVFWYFSKLVKRSNRISIIMQSKQICGNLYHKLYTAFVYRGIRGSSRFSLQYLWKMAVRIREKPYIHQRERLYRLWGNPVIFTDCAEILQLSQGFPRNL